MASAMICLDTNYLILGLVSDSREAQQLIEWHRMGEVLVTAMPAWYEFICGPVSEVEIEIMRAFLAEIIPFGETQAGKAAELFAVSGRKRSIKVDAMIAATAVCAGAHLATNNRQDFVLFEASGLRLV